MIRPDKNSIPARRPGCKRRVLVRCAQLDLPWHRIAAQSVTGGQVAHLLARPPAPRRGVDRDDHKRLADLRGGVDIGLRQRTQVPRRHIRIAERTRVTGGGRALHRATGPRLARMIVPDRDRFLGAGTERRVIGRRELRIGHREAHRHSRIPIRRPRQAEHDLVMESRRECLETRQQPGLDDESSRRRGGRPRQSESECGDESDHAIKAEANSVPDRDGSHL